MQNRSRFHASVLDARFARFIGLALFAALLMPLVSCGKLTAPTAVDTAQLAGPDVHGKLDRPQTTDPRRAPVDPIDAPYNLSIDDASWAWHVSWNATTGSAVDYQLYEFDAASGMWSLLAQTSATQFNVPKTHAPSALRVRVRAIDVAGNLSDFSAPAQAGNMPKAGDSGGSGSGGGGGVRRTAVE